VDCGKYNGPWKVFFLVIEIVGRAGGVVMTGRGVVPIGRGVVTTGRGVVTTGRGVEMTLSSHPGLSAPFVQQNLPLPPLGH
jgi:hypothetical protein